MKSQLKSQLRRPRVTTIRTQSIGPPCPSWTEAASMPWWFFWVIGLLLWLLLLCCMLCLRPLLRKKYRKRVEKKLDKKITKYDPPPLPPAAGSRPRVSPLMGPTAVLSGME
jgi:hypothetical protein